MNGCHNGKVTKVRRCRCLEQYVHYHDTGARRSIERETHRLWLRLRKHRLEFTISTERPSEGTVPSGATVSSVCDLLSKVLTNVIVASGQWPTPTKLMQLRERPHGAEYSINTRMSSPRNWRQLYDNWYFIHHLFRKSSRKHRR